jgi:hypothetical protein
MPRRPRRVKDKESTAECSAQLVAVAGIGPGQGVAVGTDHHSPEEVGTPVEAGLDPHFLEEGAEVGILDLDPQPDCQDYRVVGNQELQEEEGSHSRQCRY